MNKSFKTLFFLKSGKGSKQDSMPIYLRLTVDGVKSEMTVQRTVDPQKWNQATGRAKGSKSEIVQLNSYLDAIQGKIYTIQKEHELKNEPLTSDIVKQKLLGLSNQKQHYLLEVFQYHNDQFEALVGKEYAYGTFKKFKSVLKSLTNFIKWKYQKDDITIAELNHPFITEYEFYLKTVQKVQHNTAMGNIKKLKKIAKQCVANEWLEKDPDELIKGIDGEIWIITNRTKTDTPSRIPLLPPTLAIVEKYSNNPLAQNKGKIHPALSNQKMNTYLKEITACCGIKKDLTFHCARHTFATNKKDDRKP